MSKKELNRFSCIKKDEMTKIKNIKNQPCEDVESQATTALARSVGIILGMIIKIFLNPLIFMCVWNYLCSCGITAGKFGYWTAFWVVLVLSCIFNWNTDVLNRQFEENEEILKKLEK